MREIDNARLLIADIGKVDFDKSLNKNILANINDYDDLKSLLNMLRYLDTSRLKFLKLDIDHLNDIVKKDSDSSLYITIIDRLLSMNLDKEIYFNISKNLPNIDYKELFDIMDGTSDLWMITTNHHKYVDLFKPLLVKYRDDYLFKYYRDDNEKISKSIYISGVDEKIVSDLDIDQILDIYELGANNLISSPGSIFHTSLNKADQLLFDKMKINYDTNDRVQSLINKGAFSKVLESTEYIKITKYPYQIELLQNHLLLNSKFTEDGVFITTVNDKYSNTIENYYQNNKLFTKPSLYLFDSYVATIYGDNIPKPVSMSKLEISSKTSFDLLRNFKDGSSLKSFLRSEIVLDDSFDCGLYTESILRNYFYKNQEPNKNIEI